mmetsp:Transcript_30435/g.65548  ORF Transcript_30435/g.65548 Transcript_30435/m.65548 type:complete len:433 (-) Transcript_30435:56-1354(-)
MPQIRSSRDVVPPPAPTSPRITRPHLLNGNSHSANASGNSNTNNRSSTGRTGQLSARNKSYHQQQQQQPRQRHQSKQEAASAEALVKKALTIGLLAYLEDPDPPTNEGDEAGEHGPTNNDDGFLCGEEGFCGDDDNDDDRCFLVECLDPDPLSPEAAHNTELEEAYAPPRQNGRLQHGRGSHDRRMANSRPKQRQLEPIGLWKSLPPPVQPTPSYPSWRAPVPEDDLTSHLLLHRLHTQSQAQASLSYSTTATTTATTLAGPLSAPASGPLPPLTGLKVAKNGRSWRPAGGSRHSPMMQGEAYAPASHEAGAGELPKLKSLQGAPKKPSSLHLYRQRPYSLPPDPVAARRKHVSSVVLSVSPETAGQPSPGALDTPDLNGIPASRQDLGEGSEQDMEPWRHRLADEALRFARASDLPHSALRNRGGTSVGLA